MTFDYLTNIGLFVLGCIVGAIVVNSIKNKNDDSKEEKEEENENGNGSQGTSD